MSIPETPRIWILEVCPICGNKKTGFRLCEHQKGGDDVTGINFEQIVPVEVVEKAPVDAERERLLDLVAGLLSARLDVAPTQHHDSVDQAIVALREYGRLGDRRPGA